MPRKGTRTVPETIASFIADVEKLDAPEGDENPMFPIFGDMREGID